MGRLDVKHQQVVIAALITCYNRRQMTLKCLTCLKQQVLPPNHVVKIFLVDDGCSDGTGAAVTSEFPDVYLIQGTGQLYWCGGMRLAWENASRIKPDYYLAINDDTMIYEDTILELLNIVNRYGNHAIAVGAVSDSESGKITYGALDKRLKSVPLCADMNQKCATANANCMLIPNVVFEKIGMFYPYTHGLADYDYGFLACRNGFRIVQSQRVVGTCNHNSIDGTWCDRRLGRIDRFRKLASPTGLPFRDHFIYSYRNHRWSLLRRIIGPYIRIVLGL